MTHSKTAVILLMILISYTCAQSNKPAETTTDLTSAEPSSSVDPITPAPTTPAPTTPRTSTPSTTTSAPITTTPATTSTTAAPPTTTSSPTPRPKPTPPEFKKWSYTDAKTNQTCVIVQLALQINLTYATADNNSANVLYNVPVNGTTVSAGSCGNQSQSITVQWGPKSQESDLSLQFTLNATASEFTLSEIHLSINATAEFSDAKADQIIELYHVQNNFTTPLSMSYHCNKLQLIDFTNAKDDKVIFANATVSHLQLEAFNKQQNNDQFATARDCEAIDTPDIVPIAVGCALAGLVVIVLIVYLIGRRRAQARGYLSM